MKPTDLYIQHFERFEREAAGQHPGWVFPTRKAGLARFAELGFPTLKDEDWRFTNISAITQLPFRPVLEPVATSLSPGDLSKFAFASLDAQRLVFVDGHFNAPLSSPLEESNGARVTTLSMALARHGSALERNLARYAPGENNAFAALNTAYFTDGAFIQLDDQSRLPRPVHLLFVSTGQTAGDASHPRNLILLGANSQATILEQFVSLGSAPCLTNSVTEMVMGDGAHLEHLKLQDQAAASFHVATLQVQLSRSSDLISHSFAFGGRIARQHIGTTLGGQGIECVLNGLYVADGEQLIDHHMVVDHAQPHCNSHEYYNGLLAGHSRGVFHGRIIVRKYAQKTDAKQTNKNLLLSDDATADTKPQLEIYADDVKCTHGATIGQLNPDSIFYLRARGISKEMAKRMLIHGFAGEIIDRIRSAPVRAELDELVWQRLESHQPARLGS